MSLYVCKACDYTTISKAAYNKHLKTKKHLKNTGQGENEEIKKIADDVIEIPEADELLIPILANIPLQLLSYHIANLKNCEIDQPRNLAKSVTVE